MLYRNGWIMTERSLHSSYYKFSHVCYAWCSLSCYCACMVWYFNLFIMQLNCKAMAVITPMTMTIIAVFIAVVHCNSTCEVTPCKCSFNSIDALSKYIDERINAAVAARIAAELTVKTMEERINATFDERIANVATELNATVTAFNSESAMWTPVAKTPIGPASGLSLENATTYNFQIPDVIPLTARELLVYASVECGEATFRRIGDIILYVMHNGLRFEKRLYMHGYDQMAVNTNSDNMWFPMPADRLVHLEITVAIPGNCLALLSAIGYR